MRFWIWYMVHEMMDLSLGWMQWYNCWRKVCNNGNMWCEGTKRDRKGRGDVKKNITSLGLVPCYLCHTLTFKILPENLGVIEAIQVIQSTILRVIGIQVSRRTRSEWAANRRAGRQRKGGKPPTSTWRLETWEISFLLNTFNDWIGQIWARFHRHG